MQLTAFDNGVAERLIGSIRRECLDHIIVLGEAHLRRILNSYARYYNETRTHLALGQGRAPIAHREEGRANSLPPNPRRTAPRICPDLIFDRHTVGEPRARIEVIKFAGLGGFDAGFTSARVALDRGVLNATAGRVQVLPGDRSSRKQPEQSWR